MSDKNLYGFHGHGGHRRGGDSSDGLFGWTIFIFLLIGLVFLCWMGSYYIFARPEKASNWSPPSVLKSLPLRAENFSNQASSLSASGK